MRTRGQVHRFTGSQVLRCGWTAWNPGIRLEPGRRNAFRPAGHLMPILQNTLPHPVKLAHALFTCTRSSSCCAMPDVRALEIRQGPPVNAVGEADSPNQLFPG
jgi:hypothetical protein